jgi:transcriptional regulator with XRE-family HTH domain
VLPIVCRPIVVSSTTLTGVADRDGQLVLGRAIRELREQRGLSQKTLAAEVGVHRTYMGSVERGERNVSLNNILRIAAALGASGAELLEHAGL